MGFIQDRIDDSSLVLYQDYRAGHTLDLSGEGNNGIPANTFWASNGIQFAATGEITVADAAELQLTAGTLVVLGDFHSQNVESFIYKRDAGGTNYDFGTTAINICLYDGANTRILAASVIGHKYIAMNMANGDTGEVFIDGISAGNLGNTSAISVDDAPLLIGNDHGDASNTDANMGAALIFNRKLTATEHAQLYAELLSYKFPRKTSAKAQGSYGTELVTDGDMEAAGTAAWTAGNAATLTKENNRVLGGEQVLRVAHNGTASPFAAQISILTTGTRYRITGWARGDGTGVPNISTGAVYGLIWAGTNSTTWQPFDVTFVSAGTNVRLYAVIAVAGYCEFDNVTTREVDTAETQFKTDYAAQVSEANVTAGQIENTPFYRSTGTWKVTTDTIDGETCKVLECVAGGICYIDTILFTGDPTQDAYGTWEWWMSKTTGTAPSIEIINNVAASQTSGYFFQAQASNAVRLRERNPGTNLFTTAVSYVSDDQWYKIRITRRQSDGMFTAYIDDVEIDETGGSGSNPVADNTHTTNLRIDLDLDAGDKVAIADPLGDHSLRKMHGVIAP